MVPTPARAKPPSHVDALVELVDRLEVLGDVLGRGRPDVADSERVDEPAKLDLAGLLDRAHELLDAGLPVALPHLIASATVRMSPNRRSNVKSGEVATGSGSFMIWLGFSSPRKRIRSAIWLGPRPSMFIASRLTKCSSAACSWAGHLNPAMQRRTASPSGRTVSPPHDGHSREHVDALDDRRVRSLADDLRDHVAGTLHDHGVAGTRPSRSISSSLWSVTFETVTPPTNTGSRMPPESGPGAAGLDDDRP
jgi:hypothetical protein